MTRAKFVESVTNALIDYFNDGTYHGDLMDGEPEPIAEAIADALPELFVPTRKRKANKSSIAACAKKAENRVAKYLWGEDALRDWKEDHDLSGLDANGDTWLIEVKNWAWPAGPERMVVIQLAALEQAEKHITDPLFEHACSVLIPSKTTVESALVMYRECDADAGGVRTGPLRIVTLKLFKETVLEVHEAMS